MSRIKGPSPIFTEAVLQLVIPCHPDHGSRPKWSRLSNRETGHCLVHWWRVWTWAHLRMPKCIYNARSRFAEQLATIFPVERENLESLHCRTARPGLCHRTLVRTAVLSHTLRHLPRAGGAPLPARGRIPDLRMFSTSARAKRL